MNKEELKKVIRSSLVFLHIDSSILNEEFFDDFLSRIVKDIDEKYIPFLIKILSSKNYCISPQDTNSYYELYSNQDKSLCYHVLTLNYKIISSEDFIYHLAHSLDTYLDEDKNIKYFTLTSINGSSLLEVLTKEVNERKLKSKLVGRMDDNTRKLFYHLVSFIITNNKEKLKLIEKELPATYEKGFKLFHYLESKKPITNSN